MALSGLEVLEQGLPPHLLVVAAVHVHQPLVVSVVVAAAGLRAREAPGHGRGGRGQRLDRRAVGAPAPLAGAATGVRDPVSAAAAAVPRGVQGHARRGEERRRAVPCPAAAAAALTGACQRGAEAKERGARGAVRGGGEQARGAPRQRGGGQGGGGGGGGALLARELEDLEAVLGDGDAHGGEEVVVEVGQVGGAQLVAREEERVLERHVRVQPSPAEPRVPVHREGRGRPAAAARSGVEVELEASDAVACGWAGGEASREPSAIKNGRGCWRAGSVRWIWDAAMHAPAPMASQW
ncbi:hypothetical protein BS78_10G062600 [Paspalum vaginatum]|nr:hypothetical protein BS78_10G062600 [Paspalum vaginatum]